MPTWPAEVTTKAAVGVPYAIALGTCVVFILFIGVISGPWIDRALAVASSLF